jgi:argininosuccinate lyase
VTGPLTGRLASGPAELLREEILEPQFAFEAEHLLPHYVWIERVLLAEYRRMGILTDEHTAAINTVLCGLSGDSLRADRGANLFDIALAIERHVVERLPFEVVAWHVDRSRNDLQATAQLMYGRAELRRAAVDGLALAGQVHAVAGGLLDVPMPGYTHLQTAQVVSPGFYLAALSDQALFAVGRMLRTYDDIDQCPLGAGALAGQELPWDRPRMALLLGFAGSQPHALTAVASRGWAVVVCAELSAFAVTLGRFATDLMAWGGEAYQFVELPDELAGISSAMPQKKNYPVLERIRGRAAHVTGLAQDVVGGMRNTSYANSVEVSKEAGAHLDVLFASLRSTVRLLAAVVRAVRFRADRMRRACDESYLGALTLANRLTLDSGLPWRTAQVAAGEYIAALVATGAAAGGHDPDLLRRTVARHGEDLADPQSLVDDVFDVDRALRRYASAGSAHPDAVSQLLADQAERLCALAEGAAQRAGRIHAGQAATDRLLTEPLAGRPGPG